MVDNKNKTVYVIVGNLINIKTYKELVEEYMPMVRVYGAGEEFEPQYRLEQEYWLEGLQGELFQNIQEAKESYEFEELEVPVEFPKVLTTIIYTNKNQVVTNGNQIDMENWLFTLCENRMNKPRNNPLYFYTLEEAQNYINVNNFEDTSEAGIVFNNMTKSLIEIGNNRNEI